MLVVGETIVVPEFAETLPTPLSILAEVLLVQLELRVDELPEVMLWGEAERVAVGGVPPETV